MDLDHSRPRYQGRKQHYLYGMKFLLNPNRQSDLEETLKSFEITKYRLSANNMYGGMMAEEAFISFRIKKQALLFKLAWVPCEDVSLETKGMIIRQIVPNRIAQEILSVQPLGDLVKPLVQARDDLRPASSTTSPNSYEVRPGERSETGSDRTSGGF